jgi:CRISPR-associated protein Cmr5
MMPALKQEAKPTKSNRLTIEQLRAAHAWKSAQGQNAEYANLAKGLPALIMNSGLLQVMAFLNEKGSSESQKHCRVLAAHLRDWVHDRFTEVPAGFVEFMNVLMNADSRKFQAITAESLAWLRWLRQIAPALTGEER